MALGPDFYDYKEDFVPDEPFLLLFVGRSLGDDLSLVYPADVYAAARGWWAMNPGSRLPGGCAGLSGARSLAGPGAGRVPREVVDPVARRRRALGIRGGTRRYGSSTEVCGEAGPARVPHIAQPRSLRR